MVSKPGHSENNISEAVILAGGFGTRLKGLLGDLPKAMAPIAGKPFLGYLLAYLENSGIKRIIIATGYQHEKISDYFGTSYGKSELVYSNEETPLGTGGAVLQALDKLSIGNFFLLNGDTWFPVNLDSLGDLLHSGQFRVTVALKHMENFSRYGRVLVSGNTVVSFMEKEYCEEGFINGGVYALSSDWLRTVSPGNVFSFEKDILERFASESIIGGTVSDELFIDIGVPEDYEAAGRMLPGIILPE